MTTTPAGLRRFSRIIITKHNGKCDFCGSATHQGVDHAAVNGSGKWTTVCLACAAAIPAQVKGLVRSITDLAEGVTAEQQALLGALIQPVADRLSLAITDDAPEALAYDVVVHLLDVRDRVKAFKAEAKADAAAASPLLPQLLAVSANPEASPRDREFALSLATGLQRYGRLTERQAPHAERLVSKYTAGGNGAPVPTQEVLPGVYKVGEDLVLIRTSKTSGNLYGMMLANKPEAKTKLKWAYVKGGVGLARSGRPLTADEAAAIGHLTAHCVFCNTHLSDDGDNRSIEVGYGPVCAKKHDLPWG